MSSSVKSFHLPWHQYDHYWLGVRAKSGELPASLAQSLASLGLYPNGRAMGVKTPRDWSKVWAQIQPHLASSQAELEVTVVHGATTAPSDESLLEWRTPAAIEHIIGSLWLGEALTEDRILCYLQPVVSGRDKVFGYESFARVQTRDGAVIEGGQIMQASRALGMEFMIDRHLHVQAITTFICSDFDGFLFVNLAPGFIQRPEVYLGGLSEAARSFAMVPKHIVLDFIRAETARDGAQLKRVCEYGRSCGYSIALDDIQTLDGAKRLIADIRPDFIKIDRTLTGAVGQHAAAIAGIVAMAHGAGVMVIAEGVETEEAYHALKTAGVDLFQGYYFSPPLPVETVIKRRHTAG